MKTTLFISFLIILLIIDLVISFKGKKKHNQYIIKYGDWLYFMGYTTTLDGKTLLMWGTMPEEAKTFKSHKDANHDKLIIIKDGRMSNQTGDNIYILEINKS